MKWLQDNPLGMALAAISGVLILFALVMAIVWNLPVSVETTETATPATTGEGTVLTAHQVADMSALQVITQRPVFNESRLPVVEEVVDGEDEPDHRWGDFAARLRWRRRCAPSRAMSGAGLATRSTNVRS